MHNINFIRDYPTEFDNAMKIKKIETFSTQLGVYHFFTGKNYIKWGENPYYAYINGSFIKGYYYYKTL